MSGRLPTHHGTIGQAVFAATEKPMEVHAVVVRPTSSEIAALGGDGPHEVHHSVATRGDVHYGVIGVSEAQGRPAPQGDF